ncbi:TerD family protein [Nocardia camponoti]|uniref:Transport-associated protein n=1 Tax=Nocardia camponoti TaxID=1616106 RepID=A0A917QRN2_9NOCA|nr:TerD family protein [Nocardia camponoti]GGK65207.1 transport-associated protein [Nocardia camponoti]
MDAALLRGRTVGLGLEELRVVVHSEVGIDVAALLLTEGGLVRSDDDLVFHNYPTAPGVVLDAEAATLVVTPEAIPADIDVVRIVLTLTDPFARFPNHEPPRVDVVGAEGVLLSTTVPSDVGPVPTITLLDLIRAKDGWHARPVVRGYRGGFAEAVTTHGIVVDTPPTAPEPPRGPALAPVLLAGDDVELRREGGDQLTFVKLGLGWDPIKVQGRWSGTRDAPIDLDASALVFAGRDLIDVAFFAQLSTRDGTIRHFGDNLTGDGDGDDEIISVDLTRIPSYVTAVVFTITSYAGHTFENVKNAFWRLVDGNDTELSRSSLSAGGPHTGMLVAKLHREQGIWKLQALGRPIEANHPVAAVEQIRPWL